MTEEDFLLKISIPSSRRCVKTVPKRMNTHSFNILPFLMPVLPPIERPVANIWNRSLCQAKSASSLLVAFQRDNFLVFRFDILFNPRIKCSEKANSGLFLPFPEPLSTVFDQNLNRINGRFLTSIQRNPQP